MSLSQTLPTKLNKEPLVDAIFEMRFESSVPASSVVPGFLYSRLDGEKTLESLPPSQIPQNIRDIDLNLRYAPVSRLNWSDFYISVSDRSVMLSCKLPYPGWTAFRKVIIDIILLLHELKVIKSIERYSMKYVDIIESNSLQEQVEMIDMAVSLANYTIAKEAVQLRVEIPEGDFIKVVQIATGATVKLPHVEKHGVIVDVDILVPTSNLSCESLLSNFKDRLNELHKVNKSSFFGCLKNKTINILEPSYD